MIDRPTKYTYLRVILCLLFVLRGISAHSQQLETRLSITLDSGRLDKAVLQLQQATGFSFAYEISGLQQRFVPARSFRNQKLKIILQYLLQGTGYFFEEKRNTIIIGPDSDLVSRNQLIRRVQGIIEDKETGKRLTGVTVYDPDNQYISTITDQDGYFSLTTPSDTLRLRLSYMSYKSTEITLYSTTAPVVRIKMDVDRKDMDSVLVVSTNDIIPYAPLSKIWASPRKLPLLPGFAGDIDLLSMIKMTPGVQEANDGSGGMIVRGGAPDQNLVLLDGISIYNTAHLFGMMSAVNTSAVKDITLYKGVFPARYGGRISSVWDIALKNGNPEHFHGNITIGTMASDFEIDGPIVKDKTSFLISGRRSYHDNYVRLFTPGLTLYFQDLNVKVCHRLSEKDQLYFTAYTSKDDFRLDDDTTLDFGDRQGQLIRLTSNNDAGALRWHHRAGRLTSDLSLTYSALRQSMGNSIYLTSPMTGFYFGLERRNEYSLQDLGGKLQARYVLDDKQDLEGGLYYTRHTFKPYVFTQEQQYISFPISSDTAVQYVIPGQTVHEVGGFVEDNLKITDKLAGSAGLHLNQYVCSTQSFFSLQPRLSLRYELSHALSFNAAYARMQQSLHRVSITLTSLPIDFWVPSSSAIRPQLSDQFSLGVLYKFREDMFQLSAETYYKLLHNVVEFIAVPDSVQTVTPAEPSWNQEVTTGKGATYGIELSLKKTRGSFQGWLSYALSWSNRTLPEVNAGKTFFYKYDRRHNINLVGTYKLSKSLELSGVFSFQSKPEQPVVIVRTGNQTADAQQLKARVGSTELFAYHRLDLGMNWSVKYRKGVNAIWNLSILNVYNRPNAFYYFFNNDGSRFVGTTLLPISVSLSHTLQF